MRLSRGTASAFLLLMGFPLVGIAAAPQFSYKAGLQETLTDNVGANEGRGEGKESDLITAANLGVSAKYQGARVAGELNVGAVHQVYARDDSRNTGNVQGSGRVTAEIAERLLAVETGGSVSRRDESAFGRSSVDDGLDTGNRTTVRNWFAAARSDFIVGRDIQGQAALRRNWTSGGGDALEGSRINTSFTAALANELAYGPLGWQLNYQRQRTQNDAQSGTANLQTVRGTLTYRVSSQLNLRLTGGRETNDYENGVDQDNTIRGVGLDWVLSPRTSLNATVEKRFFGTGYDVSFRHSRPLSSFQLGYVRDVSSIESASLLSVEEIAFRDFFASLASTIPDEAERAEAARSLAGAIPNGNSTFASFVTNSFSISRRLQLSGSLVGARNVLTLGYSVGENERIGSGEGLAAGDDFASFSTIKTASTSVSWSHKLSGRSSLSAGFSHSRSEGEGDSASDVTRRSLTVGYNTRIGAHTSGAISLRRQRSEGTTDFTEHALICSISASF